jgi:excisionase family DNA binding protein
MSNHLLRSHAPISDGNWTLLDDEARERLSLSSTCVYDLIKNGALPAAQPRPGACWRVNREVVEELAARMELELSGGQNGSRP